jgi:hypothetical protein
MVMVMAKARRWLALVALAMGLALVAGFGLRAWSAWQFTQRVARGEIQVETLRGWMTLPYIARVHGVPEPELRAALGLPASGHETRSLLEWFKAAGIEPKAGRRAIEALIVARGRPASEPAR